MVIGVTVNGERDILGLRAGDGGEGAKFWLSVLTELKNRYLLSGSRGCGAANCAPGGCWKTHPTGALSSGLTRLNRSGLRSTSPLLPPRAR